MFMQYTGQDRATDNLPEPGAQWTQRFTSTSQTQVQIFSACKYEVKVIKQSSAHTC